MADSPAIDGTNNFHSPDPTRPPELNSAHSTGASVRSDRAINIVRFGTFLCGSIGILVLTGWFFNVAELKSVIPGLTTMKVNTAIGIGLTALSVWLCRTEESRARHTFLIWLLVALVSLIAVVTLCEYSFHWNAGIDELFFRDIEHVRSSYPPGRLAPGTAICFLLLSFAILVLDSWPRTSHAAIISAAIVALVALIGYLYGLPTLYGASRYSSLALHTIIAFLALCAALVAARPDRGLTALLIESSTHGSQIHFLLSTAVIVPILLGSSTLWGQRQGWYGSEFTLALFSVLLIVVTVAIVWVTGADRQKLEAVRLAAERALRDSEQRLRLAVQCGSIGIWELDVPTGERRLDSRSRAIFGFPEDGRVDYAMVVSCVHPDDRELMAQNDRTYLDPAGTGRFGFEFRVLGWNDGSLRYVYAQGQALFEGEGRHRHAVRSIGTVQDLSALKQGERALRLANLELEQFAYAAAHDLQEPLRNVGLATQLLASRHKLSFNGAAESLLHTAVEGSLRMQAMVKDLLAYSRAVQSDDNEVAYADSNAVLSLALKNLDTSIQEKQALISVDNLPPVRMPELHLLQVFQNLIGNALKYSGDRAPVVHVSSTRRSGACVFFVRDQGLGIPPEYHNRAFGVFKRLHGNDIPGTGIGLALCRRIIEHYGGAIWIESKPSEGATLFFAPPLADDKVHRNVID